MFFRVLGGIAMNNDHGMYDSKEYKKSRFAYMMECTFEYFVTLLIADAYLSNLLTAIGMSDSMIGTVSSLASLAFIFQLLWLSIVDLFQIIPENQGGSQHYQQNDAQKGA